MRVVSALLTEATELTYDVGQGDVGHTLQLILDVPRQHRVAQVPGLDGALHQRHPSAAMPLPATGREENKEITMARAYHHFNHTNNSFTSRDISLAFVRMRLCSQVNLRRFCCLIGWPQM